MNNYIQISLGTKNEQENELLIALLSEAGYDAFEESANGLHAFIPEELFNVDQLQQCIQPFNINYQQELIAPKNWNAEWESHYEPVIVDEFVAVRAHFHEPIPNVQHEIVITPKMSFGTGHHATTWQVMKLMQDIDFKDQTVFDYGCGTAVLAILAEKLGAAEVLAVDYDDWCIENSIENVQNNQCKKITVEKGDAPPSNKTFHIILANINRHILLANMEAMSASLLNNGYLLISGFYASENHLLTEAAEKHGLQLIKESERHSWSSLIFQKLK